MSPTRKCVAQSTLLRKSSKASAWQPGVPEVEIGDPDGTVAPQRRAGIGCERSLAGLGACAQERRIAIHGAIVERSRDVAGPRQ